LSYIIREDDAPDYELEAEPDYNFEQLTINCDAPLIGVVFKTDARKVHQLIHGFVQGETAEVWVKKLKESRMSNLIYRPSRPTIEAKATSRSVSRRQRISGLILPTGMKELCRVHQLIHGFVQGETAEVWVKKLKESRMGNLIYRPSRPTIEAKATSRSVSRRQRISGLILPTGMKELCRLRSSSQAGQGLPGSFS
jgi:hypothetical protein